MKLTEFGGSLDWDDGKDETIASLRAELAKEKERAEKADLEVGYKMADIDDLRAEVERLKAELAECAGHPRARDALQTARRDALEEAAGFASMMGAGNDVSKGIRALIADQKTGGENG